MASPRPARTPKPSSKKRANNAPATAPPAKRGRGGGVRSQSQPPTHQSGPPLVARGAQSQALANAVNNITSSPPDPTDDEEGEAMQPTAQPGVDEEREYEDLDGTPAPQISAAFIYNSQIQIVCGKKVLNSTVRQHTSGAGTNIPIDDAQRWIEGEVAKLTGYGLSRIVLRVGYERLASEKWLTDGVDGFAVLFKTMQRWSIEKKKGIALTVEGQTTAAPIPLPLSRARRSATNNQMAVVGAQREVMLSEGNLAPSITERWVCKVKSCYNFGHLCYWGIRDQREHYLPIYGAILTGWAQGIADSMLTADAPSGSLIQQMEQHKRRSLVKNGGRKESNNAVAPVSATHFSFAFDSNRKMVPTGSAQAPTSSPVHMPLSQSSSIELRAEFFEWCATQTSWRGEGAASEHMASVFVANGFSVEDR
ncbi:hypothetical protein B0A48_18550 [Cryoendolithus antarcticus]|uniref:Uncharacterized protein n=1 Tax=Cryoendolithus antarcticus TaxID=1507870 RepID=A0A1V8S8J0_9PEZI|nr:hypothetical protein B0A48_18550 [Cryoendolithus antarcticus]